jgi:hypothetical protein
VTIVLGVLAVAACGPGQQDADRVAAARADSSAAGYTVGGATQAESAAAGRDGNTITGQNTTTPSARPDTTAVGTPASATNVGVAKPRPDANTSGARTSPVAVGDSGREPITSPTVARPPLPVGIAHVNEFLSYDAQARSVNLLLIAGYNGLNEALNYNGGARGSQGISIPLGWSVHVSVTNRDSDLQHSAIVVRQMLPPPEDMPPPSFTGASLPHLDEGIHEGDTATFGFVADKAGNFMVACGVPGHAQGGMWMRLTVSADFDRPAYR